MSEYNDSYLKKREMAIEANRSLSPEFQANAEIDETGGAGGLSFKGELLKNRAVENPMSPIHKERTHKLNLRAELSKTVDYGRSGSRVGGGGYSSPYARGNGRLNTGMLR